ncbi:uncharacterized protein LOC120336304 [Styela clava]
MAQCKNTCFIRFRNELMWKKLWLDEPNPSKFATTAWIGTQYPFLVYRIVCFIYSASILSWNSYQASQLSSEQLVAEWFLSYPTWSFMMLTLYCTLALLLAGFNFDNDCLCNDDFSWYHKVCWVLHVISFNGSLACMIGSIAHLIARSANNTEAMTYTEVFKSDDINFYVISPMVMLIDVFIHDISVRLLHFIYPDAWFIFFSLIHVYRWAAGYIPTHLVFSFTDIPASMPSLFILFVVVIYIPVIHQIAFGIDSLRKKLLVVMWTRFKHERLQTTHSPYRNTTVNRCISQETTSSFAFSPNSAGLDGLRQSTDDVYGVSNEKPKQKEHYAMKILSSR